MVEMFKKFINVITKEKYFIIKNKLDKYMCMEIEHVRRLDFSVESSDRYFIIMYKSVKNVLVLVKEREINGCVMRKQTLIDEEEFKAIIHNDYTLVKESDNLILREMAWGMEIDGIRVLGISEYVEETCRNEATGEIYSFISDEMRYTDTPERFLSDNLSYPECDDISPNMVVKLEYLKKVNIPFAIQQVS